MAYSLASYHALIDGLVTQGYRMYPIRAYFEEVLSEPFVLLRHDVDRIASRAVAMAEKEAELGVCASYYFRCDQHLRFPKAEILNVHGLGHEVGFHYESLSRSGGNESQAMDLFQRELAALREFVPVTTIAPHGAPWSSSSNMDFAQVLGPGADGLVGDATAIDFASILYITDTGGTFGSRHNLRDRTAGRMISEPMAPWELPDRLRGKRGRRVVLSCHPERWPATFPGLIQASLQDTAVNLAKQMLFIRRRGRD